MKTWNGNDLDGLWVLTWKLDGVQVVVSRGGNPRSRNGKPLYNLPRLRPGKYEVYLGDWEKSVSAVRTHQGKRVAREHCHMLEPDIDSSLLACTIMNPTPVEIRRWMKRAIQARYEGLVLCGPKGERLKVKQVKTYDVPITDVLPGKGKYEGMMGALMTPKGKVGSGFTDDHRRTITKHAVGNTIEVESQGLTPGGKFRFPRFVRVRFDK